MSYSNRRPYYGLKLSVADLFRESVRFLKQSNTKESASEKPYLEASYPKMHLRPPGFWFKGKGAGGEGELASTTGIARTVYDTARCSWSIFRSGQCIEGNQVITLNASFFWKAEFNFIASIMEDTIGGVTLSMLPGAVAGAWDEQDFQLHFPEGSEGTVTVCGSASAYSLLSQTFETTVAGMPIGMHLAGGAIYMKEKHQQIPAKLLSSTYGTVSENCGCIDIESSCDPCLSTTAMSWDDAASSDTVARSNSVTVAVQDGVGPYNWTVSGTGFTLDNAQTVGVSNTLNADAVACGSATVTVTDDCGSVTGYVRCTTGAWTLQAWSCPIPGAWTSHVGGSFERISGQYKVIQVVAACYGLGAGESCDNIGGCNGKGTCNDYTECIDWLCSDVNAGWYNCADWCCGLGAVDCSSASGFCYDNASLTLYKWTC